MREYRRAIRDLAESLDDRTAQYGFLRHDPGIIMGALNFGAFTRFYAAAIEASGTAFAIGGSAAGGEIGYSFHLTNPRSVAYVNSRVGELIVAVSDDVRANVRNVISRAFIDGIAPRDAARILRSAVGLSGRWANALYNFSREGASASAVAAYRDKLIAQRAELIARTEIMGAHNAGRVASWRDAVQAGFLDPQSNQQWMATDDERTCVICLELDQETVPLFSTFSTGDEAPPAHPDCRCTIVVLPAAAREPVRSA